MLHDLMHIHKIISQAYFERTLLDDRSSHMSVGARCMKVFGESLRLTRSVLTCGTCSSTNNTKWSHRALANSTTMTPTSSAGTTGLHRAVHVYWHTVTFMFLLLILHVFMAVSFAPIIEPVQRLECGKSS